MKSFNTIDGTLIYNPEALLGKPSVVKESSQPFNKTFLVEYKKFIPIQSKELKEALEDPNKRLIVSGIFQRVGEENQNHRVYTFEVLAPQVEKYVKEFVNENRAIGELDHPESSVVSLSNASHNIISLEWRDKDLIGSFEVLRTPKGNILRELLRSNIAIGISSRGLGEVKKTNEGVEMVQPGFELLAFDVVSNPSVRGGFVESTRLQESVQFVVSIPKLSKEEYFETIYSKTYDHLLKCMSGMSKDELMNQM